MNELRLGRFTGLNNLSHPLDVGLEGLTDATNVILDNAGRVRRRAGYSKLLDIPVTAAWADGATLFYLSAGQLYRLAGNGPAESLGALAGTRLCGCSLGDTTYLQTDLAGVVVQNSTVRPLGLTPPPTPILTAIAGDLPAGRYTVCTTALDIDGRESGSSNLAVLDIAGGGIEISTGISRSRIYVSPPNGEQLYWLADGVSATLLDASYSLTLQEPCTRINFGPLPPGQYMDFHHSRLLVADHNWLWASEPFDYEICSPIMNALPFEMPITALSSVENGVFVGTTNKIYFLAGPDFSDYSLQEVYNSGVIARTAVKVPMSRIGDGSTGTGVLFTTLKGICLGTPDGSVTNLTERKLIMPTIANATARYHDGEYLVSY